MAFTNIISKPKKNLTALIYVLNNKNTSAYLDATVKETHTATADITQHPVEKGADISDGVILHPKGLSISGIVTKTPFPSALAGIVTGATTKIASSVGKALGPFGAAVGAVGGAQAATSIDNSVFKDTTRNLASIADSFIAIRDAKLPINVQTGLKLYKNYCISSVTVSKGEKDGEKINVDLELKEVIQVDSQTTQVAIPKKSGALNQANKGAQSKAALTADETSTGSSLLKKITGLFGGGG